MKRIIATITVVALVFGSLITFPAYLLWMAAIWLGIAVVALAMNKPAWPWLGSCVLIILIKQPGYTIGFWLCLTTVVAVAVLDWRSRKKKQESISRKRLTVFVLILATPLIGYGAERWFAVNASQLHVADQRPIACLGDSLTDYGYPQELGKLIRVPVADFGVNGITTDAGIKMIPEILAAQPQLVIIELGGHDYNSDKKPRAETRANLVKLITSFRNADVHVVLIEIPRGFVTDPYRGLERELAAEFDLQLIDDSVIRSFIFNGPILPPGTWLDPSRRYSNDGLHPNKLGNKHFANVVSRALVKLYGDSILR